MSSNREPGRHTRRGVQAMRASQLATVAGTMTEAQLRAALLTVIHADARLAQTAIDAAIEQHPIEPPPPTTPFLPAATVSFGDWVLAGGNPAEYGWRSAEGDGNHHEPGSGEA